MPHKPQNFKVNDLVIWHIHNSGVNQAMSGFITEILKVGETSQLDLSRYNTSYYGPGFDVVRQGELRIAVRIPQIAGKPILCLPDPNLLRMAGPPERTQVNPDVLQPGKSMRIDARGLNDATVTVDGGVLRNLQSISVDIAADSNLTKATLVGYTPELELYGRIVTVEPFDPLAEEESE